MKDKAQEQQRDGEIMPRFAPDQAGEIDQASTWEQFAGLPISPRRSPWPTPGSDDDDLLAQVSDQKVVITKGNAFQTQRTVITAPANKVSIRLLSRVYVSGTNLMAEYITYQIDATPTRTETETLLEGASC